MPRWVQEDVLNSSPSRGGDSLIDGRSLAHSTCIGTASFLHEHSCALQDSSVMDLYLARIIVRCLRSCVAS